ncbi:MAG: transcriptional repressor [Paramuribaculum sp.]|nr:transcriptional repressor [Paramuribaculum sp.]MDE7449475.1 transcriptional repressor [Paramuribaculum sp.]
MRSVEEILEQKGVRLTPNRILVARCIEHSSHPVSMAEIEQEIESLDKSSVFRVLMLFVEKDIVHVIDDGSGSLRYELCHGEAGHTLEDMHLHFKCENCGRIFCLESEHIPHVNLPAGYTMFTANFVAKGLCPACSLSTNTKSTNTKR